MVPIDGCVADVIQDVAAIIITSNGTAQYIELRRVFEWAAVWCSQYMEKADADDPQFDRISDASELIYDVCRYFDWAEDGIPMEKLGRGWTRRDLLVAKQRAEQVNDTVSLMLSSGLTHSGWEQEAWQKPLSTQ